MIAATTFAGKRVALFGLGGSGLATARALREGGADVAVWDDNLSARDKAAAAKAFDDIAADTSFGAPERDMARRRARRPPPAGCRWTRRCPPLCRVAARAGARDAVGSGGSETQGADSGCPARDR